MLLDPQCSETVESLLVGHKDLFSLRVPLQTLVDWPLKGLHDTACETDRPVAGCVCLVLAFLQEGYHCCLTPDLRNTSFCPAAVEDFKELLGDLIAQMCQHLVGDALGTWGFLLLQLS